jgi:regulator of nucleoside diphosphate kinase
MHFAHPPIFLPPAEYRRLQHLMLTMIGSRSPFASILRRKLGAARAVAPVPFPPDVALSEARVRFRIGGKRSDDRILTWRPPSRNDQTKLSLHTHRGLALLGLSPGETVSYRTADDRTEFLEVAEVVSAENRRTRVASAAVESRAINSVVPVTSISGEEHV